MDRLSFIEAACQILKRGFMVGETYSNRQRQYTVTEIRGPKLLVRFNDGSIGTLDAKIQRNIITNMTRNTQDVDAGSLDLRRKSMFSVGFLAAVADLQTEVPPQSSATGGEPIAREPNKTPLNERKEKAIELRRQGLSNGQISKIMGVPKATIKNYLEGYLYKA
jgi:DNA-binding CsgD family transcriptional regulator